MDKIGNSDIIKISFRHFSLISEESSSASALLPINSIMDKRKRSPEEWSKILEEHLTQIGFFQHERLIHLIVTVTFALMTLISMIASVTICMPLLLALSLLFLVLLVPYIFHYYTLENEVQKMYTQYDEIRKRI